ncbi:MAG TPA: tetratricopeptide repeat protein [Candidatus Xenobia bacterium]|jgi:tetratricopeptide (TPR) repeat protein
MADDVQLEAARLVVDGEVARGVSLLRSAATAMAEAGETAPAIELFNRIRNLDALTYDDSFALASLYRKQGEYRAAIAELQSLQHHLSLPDKATAEEVAKFAALTRQTYVALAEVYALQQNFSSAILHLETPSTPHRTLPRSSCWRTSTAP